MIEYESQKVEQKIPIKITCDVCKKKFDVEKDSFDIQEFLFVNFTAGYGSVFGDGSQVKADICQECVKKLLGEYVRIDEDVEKFE